MNSNLATKEASALSRAHGLEIRKLTKTGHNGRVIKSDVGAAILARQAAAVERVPLEGQEVARMVKPPTADMVEVSPTSPALPHGDRMVPMMIGPRTGLVPW